MLRVKRILLPTDLSDPLVLLHALRLTRPFHAELHVFHVAHGNTVRPPWNRRAFLRWLRAELDGLPETNETSLANLYFHQEDVGREVVSQEIARFAERKGIDLIVLGPLGRQEPDHTRDGQLAGEVVQRAPCPVLTFRRESVAGEVLSPQHLLVPTDFSDCSQHALMHARELAARHQARLTLLHVIPRRTMLHGRDNPLLHQILEQMNRPGFYEAHLRELFRSVPGPDVPVAFRTVNGPVVEGITGFAAETGVDLIVIATHGVTGIRHYPIGRVAEQVVRRAPVPVFAVRSFGRSLVPATPATFSQPAVTSFTHLLFEHARAFLPAPPVPVAASRPAPRSLPVVPPESR
ncbi:MAG: universal stress protein [Rhodothermaceae bacterium]|nr:MAG: universal stress protein [Rhodothermaceae bacterium]